MYDIYLFGRQHHHYRYGRCVLEGYAPGQHIRRHKGRIGPTVTQKVQTTGANNGPGTTRDINKQGKGVRRTRTAMRPTTHQHVNTRPDLDVKELPRCGTAAGTETSAAGEGNCFIPLILSSV